MSTWICSCTEGNEIQELLGRGMGIWLTKITWTRHLDPSKLLLFSCQALHPRKTQGGTIEGVFLTKSCSLWNSAVRIWELVFTGGRGKRELSSTWDWDWVCPINLAGQGDLREDGKENLGALSPKCRFVAKLKHYSHFPHLIWIFFHPATLTAHQQRSPAENIPGLFKYFSFLHNCVQLYHYLESALQHFHEYAGIFYGLHDLCLGFSLCLGCGRWELNSSVSDHLFLVYSAIKNKNSPVKYCK